MQPLHNLIMKTHTIRQVSLWIILLVIGFIALFPMFKNEVITLAQANWIMSLLYLSLCLNHLLKDNVKSEDISARAIEIFTNKGNLVISTILIAEFALILSHSGISVIKVFFVLVCSLCFCYASFILLNKKISVILFWINFYLFALVFLFTQFPGIEINVLSRYNPFAGLFLTLFS